MTTKSSGLQLDWANQPYVAVRRAFWSAVMVTILLLPAASRAATFSGNARITVNDSTGGLSWNPTTSALTVSCWFKLAIPTGTNLTENMTILVNRTTGDDNSPHAYQIRFNLATGNIEFTTRGTIGNTYTNVLIERPYLERWYHVAVVRSADTFTGYADGRDVFNTTPASVGSSATSDGVSIGGLANGKYLFGEVQEVAIHQAAFSKELIVQNMFSSQPSINSQRGYFKLAYSTNSANQLKNFAFTPVPSGTDTATVVGTGQVTFEESNQAGEQSAFDSRKNGGRDAVAPLSGAFSWDHVAFARPTPGVAFEFRFGYSSGNAFGGFKLGGNDPYASGPLGSGWRHSFETRMIPSTSFSPLADADTIGLLMWDGSIEAWEFNPISSTYETRDKEYKGHATTSLVNPVWTVITSGFSVVNGAVVFDDPDSGTLQRRFYRIVER